MEQRKQNADFSVNNEIELLSANIANLNYEVYKRIDNQYYVNIASNGSTIRIEEAHADFEAILEYNIVKSIQQGEGKILHVQKLIRNLRKVNTTDIKVPQFFKDLINDITSRI